MPSYIVAKPFNQALPVGYIVQGSGFNNTNLLLCDGSALSKTNYNELYSAIGIMYGGNAGAGTFNLPDFSHKILPRLIYQEFWETWPCVHCGKIFASDHDRGTWWCLTGNESMLRQTYHPMTNLEYLERKVER